MVPIEAGPGDFWLGFPATSCNSLPNTLAPASWIPPGIASGHGPRWRAASPSSSRPGPP